MELKRELDLRQDSMVIDGGGGRLSQKSDDRRVIGSRILLPTLKSAE